MNKKFQLISLLSLIVSMTLVPRAVYANVGIPMIMVEWPLMIISFIPIVLVESVYVWYRVDVRKWKTVKVVGEGNLYSTVFGIPIAWVFMFAVMLAEQFVSRGLEWFGLPDFRELLMNFPEFFRDILVSVVYAAWIPPSYGGMDPYFHIALFVFFIPAFVVSVLIELKVAEKRLGFDKSVLKPIFVRSNALSYGLLLMMAIVSFVLKA